MTIALDQLRVLIATNERGMRRRAKEVWEWLRANNKLEDIAAQLAAGNRGGAIAQVERAATLIAQAQQAAFMRSAGVASGKVAEAATVPFALDQTNRAVANYLAAEQSRLVRELTTAQADAVTRAISEGVRSGSNPLAVARRVRDSIGLTQHQVGQVENYRRALEAGGTEALSRTLRDRRYDAKVERAALTGEPLSPSQIDAMVDRYRERRVIRRSEDIARTEALTATHAGEDATWRQARESGDVETADIERQWWHSQEPDPRLFHLSMHKQIRGLDQPFRSGLGNLLMYPCDPTAPLIERINCRCGVTTRFKRMARNRGK